MVIERLAQDLRAAFPEMKGFSRANLMYMRAFAEAWPDAAIVQQAVGQLPWGHNLVLLDKLPGPETRRWYAAQAIAYTKDDASAPCHDNVWHCCYAREKSGAPSCPPTILRVPKSSICA